MLFFSCIKEESSKHSSIRRIVNETKVDVRVEVFGDSQRLSYDIKTQDSIDIKGFCTSGVEEYCYLGWSDLPNGRIYFGSDKVQNFTEPIDVSNKFINGDPRFEHFGYIRSDENGIDIYTYRITQEDYENAEDCNKDCENNAQ